MKQLVFKSLIFGLLSITILTFVLDPIFKDVNLSNKAFSDFNQDKDSIDILILGSSHAKNTYNPSVIDSVFDSKTYNLSTGGQLLLVSNYLLDDILKKKKPKLIIVDLFPSVMYLPGLKKSKGFQLRVFDNTPFSFSKVNAINRIYDLKEQPSVFSETIRNHDEWFKRNWSLKEFKLNESINYSNGFLGTDRIMGEKDQEKYREFVKQYQQFLKITPSEKDSLDFNENSKDLIYLIDYCEKNNIKIVFVSAPYFPSFYQKKLNKFHYSLNAFFESNNSMFIDFNKEFNTLGLGLSDFSNQGHLNINGSNKVTIGLIEKIAQNDVLEIKDTSQYKNLLQKIEPRVVSKLEENTSFNIEAKTNQLLSLGVRYKSTHRFTESMEILNIVFSIDNKHRYVILESKTPIKNLKETYYLISKAINKKDFSKRPKWQLGTNKNKLYWEAEPQSVTIDGKNYLLFTLDKKCEITNFDNIRIVLKDKKTKNNVVNTNALTLKNIKIIK